MKDQISSKQAGLILVLFTIALKLSVLPGMINDFAAKNAYVVCFIALAIDLLATIVIILIMRKIPNKNFFDLIKETLSKPVAIIIYALLLVYFLMKCLSTLLELHDYYLTSLFEELNPIFFLIALIFFFLWILGRGFQNLGRTLQICFWPMAIGLTFTLIYPVSDIRITNLLPIFEDGVKPIWDGLFRTSYAFGDYVILFLLMGKISFDKKTPKTLIVYMFSALSFILNFYVIFQGCFGNTTVNQTLALNELPLHNPYPVTVNKLEWLTIVVWTAILIFNAVLLGKCACECFGKIFNCIDKKLPVYVVTGTISISLMITYLQLYDVLRFCISTPFAIISNVFHYLLILLLIIAYFIHKKRNKLSSIEPIKMKKKYIKLEENREKDISKAPQK